MVHPDILHCWHLGTARDFLASAIVLLLKRGYFRGRNQAQRLQAASKSLQSFAKLHRLSLSKKKLTKNSLTWKPHQFPELRMKGADAIVIGKWLSSIVQDTDCGLHDLPTALWASDNCFALLANNHGYFLSQAEYQQLRVVAGIVDTQFLLLFCCCFWWKMFLFVLWAVKLRLATFSLTRTCG